MTPELKFSFAIDLVVDKPFVVSNSPQKGKRQLIPITSGQVSGDIKGIVLPGGVDSQIIQPDGLCRLSARYALRVEEGTIYVENNGIRRIPQQHVARLFGEDMLFFSELAPEDIYFRTVPTFEVDSEKLDWLVNSLFVCSALREEKGVKLAFYRVL